MKFELGLFAFLDVRALLRLILESVLLHFHRIVFNREVGKNYLPTFGRLAFGLSIDHDLHSVFASGEH